MRLSAVEQITLKRVRHRFGERHIDITHATEHEIETDEFLKVAFSGAVKV